jgi:hypothetical protein
MAHESKSAEVDLGEIDLGDGIEAVGATPRADDTLDEAESSDQGEPSSSGSTGSFAADTNLNGSSASPHHKGSQSSLQSSSSRTISLSTVSAVDEDPLKTGQRETLPPAYQDVEAQRRESDATTSTAGTDASEVTAEKQQAREERASGKGFFSWLTRTRPPPPYPSERTVSPEYTAGILSRLTFQWMSPIMSVSHGSSLCFIRTAESLHKVPLRVKLHIADVHSGRLGG